MQSAISQYGHGRACASHVMVLWHRTSSPPDRSSTSAGSPVSLSPALHSGPLVAVQCYLNSVDAGDGLPAAVTCEHGHCCFARAAAGSLIGLRPLAYISRDSPTVASFRFTLLLPAARGASTPQPAGHSPACTLLPASRPDSCSPKVAASSVGPRPRLCVRRSH